MGTAPKQELGLDLFRSDEWRGAWLSVWGPEIARRHGRNSLLPESGPVLNLYRARSQLRWWLALECLQFIGASYRGISTVRAEYNEFCFEAGETGDHEQALASLSAKKGWNMLVLSDIQRGGKLHEAVQAWSAERGWHIRQTHEDRAWHVDVRGSWGEYLTSRGGGARRRLMANRRKLAGGAGLGLEPVSIDHLDAFLDELNDYHLQRWGAPCYGPTNRALMKTFLLAVDSSANGRLDATRLVIGDKTVSVMLNLLWKGRIYNLQSGFDSRFAREGPGYVHLGMAIERAFGDPSVHTFDMLAGGGKSTDYKSDLATGSLDLCSVMLLRSALLGRAAKAYYALRGRTSMPATSTTPGA